MNQVFANLKDNGSGLEVIFRIVSHAVLEGARQGYLTEQHIHEIRNSAQSTAYCAGAAFAALGFDRMDCDNASDNAAASGLVLAGTLLTELAYLHDSLDSADLKARERAAKLQDPC